MTDYSSLFLKIDALKAKIARDSITPSSLGSLLEEILLTMESIDMTSERETIRSALTTASSALAKAVSNEKDINTLLHGNVSEAIDNLNEIIAFLDGVKDDERFASYISDLDDRKYDIDYLERRIAPKVERTSEWNDGYIRTTSDGSRPVEHVSFTPVIQSPYRHRIIKCKEGDRFKLNYKGGTFLGRAWNFLAADKSVIAQSSLETIDEELVAPAGARYLVMNATISYGTFEFLNGSAMKKTLNLLCFGNSFTEDSMGYVPMILKRIAPEVEVTIGIAYLGGCSLQQHLANFCGRALTDAGTEYTPKRYTYYLNQQGTPWATQYDKSLDDILADKEWDVVTFQQNGSQSYLEWTDVIWPFISELVKLLAEKVTKPVKCGWLLTHGAYGASDAGFEKYWRGTADNAEKTENALGCIVFPYGTAVQNMRRTELRTLGDGSAHNLTIDNGHLQEGIGCYGAALANAMKILQLVGVDKTGILGDTTDITEASITAMNVPGRHLGTGIIGMTPENRIIAQRAAVAAIRNPYCLTDISTGELTPDTNKKEHEAITQAINRVAEDIAKAKIALFDDMWASIDGTKLDNGNYRKTAAGKELTLAEAIVRYERNGFIEEWNHKFKFYGWNYYQRPYVTENGGYNEFTLFYEGNGLNNITHEQAVNILRTPLPGTPKIPAMWFAGYDIRTNVPRLRAGTLEYCPFFAQYRIEVIALADNTEIPSGLCYQCFCLHTIKGVLKLSGQTFASQTWNLENVTVYCTKANISYQFKDNRKLSYDSVKYTIEHTAVVCTLIYHPDVYAKLTGDTTNEAAAALTEEELAQWQDLLATAVSKNIAIATV
ncbi:MAG: DUF4886 domain-containing protein [Barnesiella sp.]|nr:DUF4886 domain-containing protein [Barnesiella sp.]